MVYHVGLAPRVGRSTKALHAHAGHGTLVAKLSRGSDTARPSETKRKVLDLISEEWHKSHGKNGGFLWDFGEKWWISMGFWEKWWISMGFLEKWWVSMGFWEKWWVSMGSFMGSFMRYGKKMGYIELWTSISGCSWDLKTTKKRYNHGELNPHKLGHGPPYHYGYIMSYIIHLWLELHFHGVIMLKKGWLKNIVEDKPTIEWDWIPRLSFTTKIEGIQQ